MGQSSTMNLQTGAIAQFETEADAKLAGYEVKLSKERFTKFQSMNRHARRAQIAQERQKVRLK